ncbi:class I SAM-dependent DNA methyltransferase [Georgenia yuyongxinii]|uniref:site-specific DNA-methyltransferase (adenine-specific) n=1 Tax=Georgenia yuyongxinii TaxID=2589797 RepID=A0A552WXF6_9MICO|nr:class I SAM-dependent DNA methyltransferase [Georgenia yuyongxinii]TRW47454.1 class I SAM-dependent DNA methyltransferase [Georgenia yuyongxinii]
MAVSDALIVGEGWISEHYFTTDATKQSFQARVLERRKAWEENKDIGSVRTRFTQHRRWLLDQFATLGESQNPTGTLREVYDRLLDVLGYRGVGLRMENPDPTSPVLRATVPGIEAESPLAVVEGTAVDSVDDLLAKDAPTLLTEYWFDEKTPLTSVARTVSTLFVSGDAPEFVLVLAGQFALVAERERWAEGRYLAVDLQLVCERNDDRRGGEVDKALTCISAESVAPDAEGTIWWHDVLEESVRHTVGVSRDLREGVRLSIEIIGNEVVRRRNIQGLQPLPADQAQPLAKQALRFLYRILFLLYAEASPEMGVLPTGASEYERGYSLDRLRDLTLVELTSPRAKESTHLYQSLAVLFRLVNEGHDGAPADDGGAGLEGLTFRNLKADLFDSKATALIDEVGLGDEAMQQVLGHLLVSKETRGKDRGFISYAELGINQLGAVYEGLMSYTGFFAEEDLNEVAKNGDASKGSWVVPIDRADHLLEQDFVKTEDPDTGERRAVLHKRGGFVFRLSGRARQQSASYYTPEVLTRFTVSQALAELLDQDGRHTSAREILDLTVCEPALGSGAFAIEAVRQLAEEYLRRHQDELDVRIDPDEYPRALQRVKAYLALHQVYGVDLNATAVELAEISLWLDTMVAGLDAPWFGLHLRRGNSLIGARRAVYRRSQVADKSWQRNVPRDVPLKDLADDAAHDRLATGVEGSIHHFLLPAAGWGSTAEAKEAKELVPDAVTDLKVWRRTITAKPTKKQVDALVDLSYRVERLWQIALRRLQVAEQEIRRSVDVWGADDLPVGGRVQRAEIEAALAEAGSAYRRLRRVMDAWTALWFWPLTESRTTIEVEGERRHVRPPTLDQWIEALQLLLGRHSGNTRTVRGGDQTLGAATTWEDLGTYEELDLGFASTARVDDVLRRHPWLRVCEDVAAEQGFFHWDLDFVVPLSRGGFDLQVGNPPWVRPDTDIEALLAEGDPWWQLRGKATQTELQGHRAATLDIAGVGDLVVESVAATVAVRETVSAPQNYPALAGLRPDLYRCFMERTWNHVAPTGAVGLVHPETHFTDEKAGLLRAATYERLRRHWQFVNELQLFDVHHLVSYGVHVYGTAREPAFLHATSLYHPDTVERSFKHDGTGPEPGLKDPDGNWDLRPHHDRILEVNRDVLATWHEVLENEQVPVLRTRMVYTVNRSAAEVLAKLAAKGRVGDLDVRFSAGWNETTDRQRGYFDTEWGPAESWDDVILQGPHLHVATPFYKWPNPTMLHNLDWSPVGFERLSADAVPVTSYKPAGDRYQYDCDYTDWGTEDRPLPARDFYRVAWRNMANNVAERTLIPAIIPPGAAHIHGITSAGAVDIDRYMKVALIAAASSSLLCDFTVRAAPKSTISAATFNRLPLPEGMLVPSLLLRVLRLNCLTAAYDDMWLQVFSEVFQDDSWAGGLDHPSRPALGAVDAQWSDSTPLRRAADRRQALVEIDALVALSLGVTADELCSIYRTQFPVLYGYDRNRDHYDINGHLVPGDVIRTFRTKGERISVDERTATNAAGYPYTYELPFRTLDREHDMRVAYAEFERRLEERA